MICSEAQCFIQIVLKSQCASNCANTNIYKGRNSPHKDRNIDQQKSWEYPFMRGYDLQKYSKTLGFSSRGEGPKT